MGCWAKAGWLLFVIVLPFLGVLAYVLARGRSMSEREMAQVTKREAEFQDYRRADQARPAQGARRPLRSRVPAGQVEDPHLNAATRGSPGGRAMNSISASATSTSRASSSTTAMLGSFHAMNPIPAIVMTATRRSVRWS